MRGRWLFLLLLTILICGSAAAQDGGYPDYGDVYINDFASVLSPSVESDIRELLYDLWSKNGIQATVVTIDSYTDYDTSDSTFEEFATNLFNTWGVGDSDSDGVMILVAVSDRKVRIEVGSSYESTMNRPAQGIIDEFMLPRFREGNYERGIYDGTRGLISSLTGVFPESAIPTIAPTLSFVSPTRSYSYGTTNAGYRTSSDNNNLLVFAAGAAGVVVMGGRSVWRRYARNRPRKCPTCQNMMVRLDEVEDDAFLDEGQRTEEMMKSVDYDVWKCQTCGTHQVLHYKSTFSGHHTCPNCKYRTVTTSSRVMFAATYASPGLREVTHDCRHCHYTRTFQEQIPRKTRPIQPDSRSGLSSSRSSSMFSSSRSSSSFSSRSSSSSSRSSSASSSSSSRRGGFGGGKSSGGGASGKW